jgi:hypothetical protein
MRCRKNRKAQAGRAQWRINQATLAEKKNKLGKIKEEAAKANPTTPSRAKELSRVCSGLIAR